MTDDDAPRMVEMAAADYHALDRLSASGMKEVLRSPAHYKAWRATPPKPSAAMEFGTLLHAAVLEPATLESLVAVMPEDAPDRRTKDGRAWHEAFAKSSEGRIVIDRDARERLTRVAEAVLRHPTASMLVSEATVREGTLLWTEAAADLQEVPMKARLDAVPPDFGYILDVKTAADAGPRAFQRAVANFQYDLQAAVYMNAAQVVKGVRPVEYLWLVVETGAPFGVAIYSAHDSVLRTGHAKALQALETYAGAARRNEWHGYPLEVQTMVLPAWAMRDTFTAQEY